jgi:hypothetical protein
LGDKAVERRIDIMRLIKLLDEFENSVPELRNSKFKYNVFIVKLRKELTVFRDYITSDYTKKQIAIKYDWSRDELDYHLNRIEKILIKRDTDVDSKPNSQLTHAY